MKTVWFLTQPSACREHVWKAGGVCVLTRTCVLISGLGSPSRGEVASLFLNDQYTRRNGATSLVTCHLYFLYEAEAMPEASLCQTCVESMLLTMLV